jgi:undecaprenyl diphosphate synthase
MTDDFAACLTPKHMAIIPDGNRRWARARGLTEIAGHDAGVEAFWRALPAVLDGGVEYLSMYLFSPENWARSADQVESLMQLLIRFFADCRHRAPGLGIAPKIIGDLSDPRIPDELRAAIDAASQVAVDDARAVVTFAVNYGSLQSAAAGSLSDLPPVDLLVRTGGQRRLSNFMLMESAYAELSFLEQLWPDIEPVDLTAELRSFAARVRSFGGD